MGNGHPVSAVITTQEIADAFEGTKVAYFNTVCSEMVPLLCFNRSCLLFTYPCGLDLKSPTVLVVALMLAVSFSSVGTQSPVPLPTRY